MRSCICDAYTATVFLKVVRKQPIQRDRLIEEVYTFLGRYALPERIIAQAINVLIDENVLFERGDCISLTNAGKTQLHPLKRQAESCLGNSVLQRRARELYRRPLFYETRAITESISP